MKMGYELVIGVCCEVRVRLVQKECGCSLGVQENELAEGKERAK